MSNKIVNTCGLSCPQPVLLTQKAIEAQGQGTVEVLVDNATARENVMRRAAKSGWRADVTEQADGVSKITLTK